MFRIFVDGTCNLPEEKLTGLSMLPCSFTVDGVLTEYTGNLRQFDGHSYYQGLREGRQVKTSLVNTHTFLTHFRPVLEAGEDILYIAMSSNISGTYQAAKLAEEELLEDFPQRFIHIVDARGCGLGIGLLALLGVELRAAGKDVRQTAGELDEAVPHMCQYFTVDDLNFLKNTGRVSGATAMIGTVLNIKPILYGTAEGFIVSGSKCRGRKKAMDGLVQMYQAKVQNPECHTVAISHGDCPEEAAQLAERIRAAAAPKELLVVPHEPFSGAHVGPGMLAVFFYGKER